MDAQQALQSARDLLVWTGPLIAGGALAKVGENAADQAAQLASRTWRALQGWLAHDADAADDLRKLEKQPDSASRQQIVAEAIAQIAARDVAVATELEALTQAIAQIKGSTGGRTHNQTIGDNAQVGVAIAGDHTGNITIGEQDFSRDKRTISAVAHPARVATPDKSALVRPTPRPPLPTTLSTDGEHFTYGHALVIGVGTYQRDRLSVATTAADAVRLGELLRDPQVAAYPTKQVTVLTNAQATRDSIVAALDTFAQALASARNATAMIFFAGHGKQHESGYYLLPHDYTPDNVAGSAISAAEFHAKIDTIRQRAQKLIVLLNCCHSGGIGDAVLDDTGSEVVGDTPPVAFYQPLVAGGGQVVISAARPWQKAGAKSSIAPQHTLFGARLLDALRGQAPGDAPGIGVFELFSYLSAQVPTDARQIIYKSKPLAQEPLLYAHQLDANIPIALRPNWQGGTLDADLETTIQELAQIEIELAGYAREADAPEELIRRRDELLQQL